MSDQRTYDAMRTASLAIQVDGARAPADPIKFTAIFLALGGSRLAACQSANAAAENAASDATGARVTLESAVTRLGALDRNVFNFIKSVDDETLPPEQKAAVFEAYLFPGGELRDMEDQDRVLQIARKISEIAASPPPSLPVAGLAPAATVTRVNSWLAIYDGNALIANGGDRETLIATRNDKRDDLENWNTRARGYYIAGSDDGEYSKELAKIGLQPKRMPGEAQPEPKPDAPGTVTFDPATRTLTVTALPGHATSLIAYRQPAGGEVVEAGVSTGTTVSVVSYGPLMPGVTYTLWVEGSNSRGQGPKSNVITFTA
jgi:hypothetical protein